MASEAASQGATEEVRPLGLPQDEVLSVTLQVEEAPPAAPEQREKPISQTLPPLSLPPPVSVAKRGDSWIFSSARDPERHAANAHAVSRPDTVYPEWSHGLNGIDLDPLGTREAVLPGPRGPALRLATHADHLPSYDKARYPPRRSGCLTQHEVTCLLAARQSCRNRYSHEDIAVRLRNASAVNGEVRQRERYVEIVTQGSGSYTYIIPPWVAQKGYFERLTQKANQAQRCQLLFHLRRCETAFWHYYGAHQRLSNSFENDEKLSTLLTRREKARAKAEFKASWLETTDTGRRILRVIYGCDLDHPVLRDTWMC